VAPSWKARIAHGDEAHLSARKCSVSVSLGSELCTRA
jgi:hypothetical protein